MIIDIKNTKCRHNSVQWIKYNGSLHIKCCECGIIFNTISKVRDTESEPFKTPEGLYSKMQYPIAIDIDTPMITKEQLWYICNIYPEHIEHDEAKEDYNKIIDKETDDSYWQVAAKIVNDLTHTEVNNHEQES